MLSRVRQGRKHRESGVVEAMVLSAATFRGASGLVQYLPSGLLRTF